jgi:nitroreductase
MEVSQAIKARRSIKYYDPNHQLTSQEESILFDLAMQAPSSFNLQHWRLVRVSDPLLRKKIRAAAWDQPQVTDASLLLILAADLKAWDKQPARYWKDAPAEIQQIIVPYIKPFYEGKDQLQRDEAMRSVGLIAQTLMLATKGLGYDSCPMIGFDPDQVASLIRLPQDHVIGMMLVIGKAVKQAYPKPGFLSQSEVIIDNQF